MTELPYLSSDRILAIERHALTHRHTPSEDVLMVLAECHRLRRQIMEKNKPCLTRRIWSGLAARRFL